jgi:hypothetical protein
MDLFSFLSFHFMCVTVTVVTGHSVALSRRSHESHLFSTMSSLHDVLVHDKMFSLCYIVLLFLRFFQQLPHFPHTMNLKKLCFA